MYQVIVRSSKPSILAAVDAFVRRGELQLELAGSGADATIRGVTHRELELLRRRRPVAMEVYEDDGLRFEYPSDWTLEVTDDGPTTTVSVEAPGGLAFALVRTDESRPDPDEVADEALEAMREDYPDLDAVPAVETVHEHRAIGHDVEFFSLDFANAASIRCFRTPRRTVLMLGQWSDLGDERLPELVHSVIRSLEETND
jgi:hypothetical protein